MNIEIVEFYPLERNEKKEFLSGTLRVKLIDYGIHILGVFVSKRKNFWHFKMPGRKGTHHETGQEVWFPFVLFEDKEKNRALIEAIREQGQAFISKRLNDTENPLIFPQKQQQDVKQAEHPKICGNPTASKETVFSANPKPATKKVWQDPPKRKPLPHRSRKYG